MFGRQASRSQPPQLPSLLAMLVLILGAWAGCTGHDDAAPAAFTVRPGVEHVTVTKASPGTALTLYNAQGRPLVALITDDLGQAVFAYIPDKFTLIETGSGSTPMGRGETLKPGGGYTIRNETVEPIDAGPVGTEHVLRICQLPRLQAPEILGADPERNLGLPWRLGCSASLHRATKYVSRMRECLAKVTPSRRTIRVPGRAVLMVSSQRPDWAIVGSRK